MVRLTITLEDNLHLSLKETAIRQRVFYREHYRREPSFTRHSTKKSSLETLNKTRKNAKNKSKLNDADAMALALDETNGSRKQSLK